MGWPADESFEVTRFFFPNSGVFAEAFLVSEHSAIKRRRIVSSSWVPHSRFPARMATAFLRTPQADSPQTTRGPFPGQIRRAPVRKLRAACVAGSSSYARHWRQNAPA